MDHGKNEKSWSSSEKLDVSLVAEHIGIIKPKVMRSYAGQCPYCGEKTNIGPDRVCFSCGLIE